MRGPTTLRCSDYRSTSQSPGEQCRGFFLSLYWTTQDTVSPAPPPSSRATGTTGMGHEDALPSAPGERLVSVQLADPRRGNGRDAPMPNLCSWRAVGLNGVARRQADGRDHSSAS